MQSAISFAAATALALPAGAGSVGTASLAGNSATANPGVTPFADLFADSIGQVNQLETQAHSAVSGLMTGSGVDVHQAMIASEKASMAFELALAVRNKAVQAYQQVMSMQF
jgi:flagellar hook-basal body complex protein FliE